MLKRQMTNVFYQTPRASFVMFKGDKFVDRGKGEEQVYFSQQERNVLKKLLLKMENETKAQRQHLEYSNTSSDGEHFVPTSEKRKREAEAEAKRNAGLQGIFRSHGIKGDKKLMEALENWKREQ